MSVLIRIASLLIFLILVNNVISAHMSEKQVKAAGKLVRNSCQPKNQVSDEDINNTHKGIFSEAQNVKCYFYCLLTMMKVTKKNGDPDWDTALSMTDTLPEARIEPIRKSIMKCRQTEPGVDKCDTAWLIAKCMYFDNPENYVYP